MAYEGCIYLIPNSWMKMNNSGVFKYQKIALTKYLDDRLKYSTFIHVFKYLLKHKQCDRRWGPYWLWNYKTFIWNFYGVHSYPMQIPLCGIYSMTHRKYFKNKIQSLKYLIFKKKLTVRKKENILKTCWNFR